MTFSSLGALTSSTAPARSRLTTFRLHYYGQEVKKLISLVNTLRAESRENQYRPFITTLPAYLASGSPDRESLGR